MALHLLKDPWLTNHCDGKWAGVRELRFDVTLVTCPPCPYDLVTGGDCHVHQGNGKSPQSQVLLKLSTGSGAHANTLALISRSIISSAGSGVWLVQPVAIPNTAISNQPYRHHAIVVSSLHNAGVLPPGKDSSCIWPSISRCRTNYRPFAYSICFRRTARSR